MYYNFIEAVLSCHMGAPVNIVVGSIPTRWNKINIFFYFFAQLTRQSIVTEHAMPPESGKKNVGNRSVLIGTECLNLNTRFSVSFCLHCYVRNTA